jgi:hypothetical protein
MKAFVSYSFKDSELHVVTLLFEQLRRSGYMVEASMFGSTFNSENSINGSDVFIGIITNNSSSINFVLKEWEIAKRNNINNILIIEDGVNVEDPHNLRFIRFNRNNPNPAIDKLFNIKSRTPAKKEKSSEVLKDVLIAGGIIVGVAALIELLSGGGKK